MQPLAAIAKFGHILSFCDPADPGGKASSLSSSQPSLMATRLFIYSKGKWETHAVLGEMWKGGVASAENSVMLVVCQECLRLTTLAGSAQIPPFSPCTAKISHTEILTISKSKPIGLLWRT